MSQKTLEKPRIKAKPKTQRPPLWKVILLNDDFTPREFVVLVLKAVFRMNESHAYKVMMTAHQKGACVIAVYTRDVAETKAKEATEMGRAKGYPALFHDRERRVGRGRRIARGRSAVRQIRSISCKGAVGTTGGNLRI